MKKLLLTGIIALAAAGSAMAQTSKVYNKRIVCHDPSIFMDKYTNGTAENPRYYIYGSHLGRGWTDASSNYMAWTNYTSWSDCNTDEGNNTSAKSMFANPSGSRVNFSNAYSTHAITKVKNYQGTEVSFGNFDAHGWQASGNSVAGMEWAPDVIYNTTMKKWCMYMSLNGDNWCSSICCFTSDNPEGPWTYQGPVVFSGFQGYYAHNNFTATNDWQHTDLAIATGCTSLPERYNVGKSWGSFWPNCIDPCVFYDQEGKLWMSYGSWSGGVFIIQLDETTGLRDYTVTYPYQVSGSDATPGAANANCTCDPYFGKKIAGGYYVSGEASYIQYFNGYYYLFMSYGGLTAAGGYQIRVFRSTNPDGPYKDCCTKNGIDAVYSVARTNFGANANRDEGVKLFGNYKWPSMTVGELAQGHNSAIVDHNGHMLLCYHTRFNNGSEGHQVRIHELFQNQDGWLVAAPFEYGGETVTQDQIASQQLFSASEVAGTYQIMFHYYRQDTANKEMATLMDVSLNPDGSITADGRDTNDFDGTWSIKNGYITLYFYCKEVNYGDVTFKGVLTEQTTDITGKKVLCFTALSSSSGEATSGGATLQTRGLSIWGMKTSDAEGGTETTTTYYPVSQQKNTTAGWWANFSTEYYPLADGESVSFKFKNYSDKANNWDNWVLYGANAERGADGYKEYFGIRADNWDVVSNSNTYCTSAFNWDTFKSDMDGSTVDMTCTYSGGQFYMTSTITTSAGKEYPYSFTRELTDAPSQLKLFFVNEKSYIDGSTLAAINAPTVAPYAQSNAIYNIAGQRVSSNYKGVVVKNGHKYIQK